MHSQAGGDPHLRLHQPASFRLLLLRREVVAHQVIERRVKTGQGGQPQAAIGMARVELRQGPPADMGQTGQFPEGEQVPTTQDHLHLLDRCQDPTVALQCLSCVFHSLKQRVEPLFFDAI